MRTTPLFDLFRKKKKTEETLDAGVAISNKAEPTRKEIETAAEQVSREIEIKMLEEQPYCLPDISLLNCIGASDQPSQADTFEEDISAVFSYKGIAAVFVERSMGPKYTRYEFKVAPGTRLVSIKNTHKDIAFAVGASEVKISPVIGKPSTIAVDIPNAVQNVVSLREAISSTEFSESEDKLLFAVGKNTNGEIILGSLPEIRGLLLSGTIGAGKSVFLNSLIVSLLYKASPEEVRFMMIDPKMVEFAPYSGIPHLLIPVVIDSKKALGALQWIEFEMNKRYRKFAKYGAKDLSQYNQMASRNPRVEKEPSIVVLIDELNDLMAINPEEIEDKINHIVQLGLAAGIYMVIASSKPKRAIAERMPSRIAFAMTSESQSNMVIRKPGAERLLGKGDMLFLPAGRTNPENLQGFYVSPEEIKRVVEFIKYRGEPCYEQNVLDQIEAECRLRNGSSVYDYVGFDEDGTDELLDAAVDVVLEVGMASVSMLQRRLKLGYSRAARLVDQMEERGYVGPFEGSKPRQLLIDKAKWQELKMKRNGGEPKQKDDRFGFLADLFNSHDALD